MEIMIQWDKPKDDGVWPVVNRHTGEEVALMRRTSRGGYSVLRSGETEWTLPQNFPVSALALI